MKKIDALKKEIISNMDIIDRKVKINILKYVNRNESKDAISEVSNGTSILLDKISSETIIQICAYMEIDVGYHSDSSDSE